MLYKTLINELIGQGYHTILGVISLPNSGSVALHEKLGFTKAGQMNQVGYKFGRWIDVAYWQLILNSK